MCGRITVVSQIPVIEKLFGVTADPAAKQFKPNYNLSVGQLAPVILSEAPRQLTLATFGLTPSWAKKQTYLFNARAEGDGNKDDSPMYTGGMGIINKPSFRLQIRQQRCLVIANCFFEGSKEKGLSEPYLIHLKDRRIFTFAGIYDHWTNPGSGEVVTSFSIITTYPNELLYSIRHHRCPVILPRTAEGTWLQQSAALGNITGLLRPYPAMEMVAYPVTPQVKNVKNNYRELLLPTGPVIDLEEKIIPTEPMKRGKSNGAMTSAEIKKKMEENPNYIPFDFLKP